MKKSQYTDHQIVNILKQANADMKVKETEAELSQYKKWIREYSKERSHDSLGRIPPAVFRRRVENAGNSSLELSH